MQPRAEIGRPARNLKALRSRVERLFGSVQLAKNSRQEILPLGMPGEVFSDSPIESLSGFIDFLSVAHPHGEIYLFGGVLRDLALFGRRGFDSDIDIVVEGEWATFSDYLQSIGAIKNKFGGYRLQAGEWPIDIWNAEETWAIRQGIVAYEGVSSLTHTTVLNWDAILMNWRSRAFICAPDYLESLCKRKLDVVLEENPNPVGMAVRVLRHLSSKDARQIGPKAALYLERVSRSYDLEALIDAEMKSYRNSLIEPSIYRLFLLSAHGSSPNVDERLREAAADLMTQGAGVAWKQIDLSFKLN